MAPWSSPGGPLVTKPAENHQSRTSLRSGINLERACDLKLISDRRFKAVQNPTVLRTLRGHDTPTTRNKLTQFAGRPAGCWPLMFEPTERDWALGGVGEKGLDRITKAAVPTISKDAATRRASRPRLRSAAFCCGGDRLCGTRDGDGTWTEISRSVADRH